MTTREAAEHALAEYRAVYEAGGEIAYPHWAEQLLKAEQAERLAEELGEEVE